MALLPANVRLRPIALPVEHGGWGFLLEPIVIGLALAWSGRGLALAVAAVAAFLLRQPLKLWWSDVAANRRYPRTPVALVAALVYGALAAGGLMLAFASDPRASAPLFAALPLVVVLSWFDAKGRSRDIVPELLGPVALAAVGASAVLLGGWSLPRSLALWALLVLRAVPSVVYVRARLRLEHGRGPNLFVPLAVHSAAILPVLWLARQGMVPLAVTPLYALLLLRCWAGLSSLRRRFGAKSVGFSEVRWGLIAIAWIVIAYRVA